MKRRIIWLTSVLLSVLLGIFIGNIKSEEENINFGGTFKNKSVLSMMLETGVCTECSNLVT